MTETCEPWASANKCLLYASYLAPVEQGAMAVQVAARLSCSFS
jgi:hypothetical protein